MMNWFLLGEERGLDEMLVVSGIPLYISGRGANKGRWFSSL